MAGIRNVRKHLRKEVLKCVATGHGDLKTLTQVAREIVGNGVGVEKMLEGFYAGEVSKALAVLRSERRVESVGKDWKVTSDLDSTDVDTISLRRLKRLRGELTEEKRLAHEFGRTEEAVLAARMLDILSSAFASDAVEATVVLEPSAVSSS